MLSARLRGASLRSFACLKRPLPVTALGSFPGRDEQTEPVPQWRQLHCLARPALHAPPQTRAFLTGPDGRQSPLKVGLAIAGGSIVAVGLVGLGTVVVAGAGVAGLGVWLYWRFLTPQGRASAVRMRQLREAGGAQGGVPGAAGLGALGLLSSLVSSSVLPPMVIVDAATKATEAAARSAIPQVGGVGYATQVVVEQVGRQGGQLNMLVPLLGSRGGPVIGEARVVARFSNTQDLDFERMEALVGGKRIPLSPSSSSSRVIDAEFRDLKG